MSLFTGYPIMGLTDEEWQAKTPLQRQEELQREYDKRREAHDRWVLENM